MDKTIKLPETSKFLLAPDHKSMELYIVHTLFPISVIWVRQTTPAQLILIETELDVDDAEVEGILSGDLLEENYSTIKRILEQASQFWKEYAANNLNSMN